MGKPITIPETRRIPVSKLKVDKKNPNLMTERQFQALKENFKRYGFLVPIITNKKLVIADGEHRWRAAKELGMKEIPVVVLDVDEVDRRILRQILNKLKGTHDPQKDLEEFQFLMDQDQLQTLADLSAQEPSKMLKLMDEADEYKIDHGFDMDQAYKGKPMAKPEELWQLGKHFLYVGDSLEEETYARMPVKTFHATFTDPPYNVAYNATARHKGTQRAKGTILNDDLSAKAYQKFMLRATGKIINRTKGSIYVCMGTSSLPVLMRTMAANGAHWSSNIIWAKNHFTLSRKDYQPQYECIWYGWKEGNKHTFYGGRTTSDFWEETPAKKKRHRRRRGGDIWRHNKPNSSPNHPTTKPLELVRHAILDSTLKGQSVFDPFLGSGSTLIACEQTGRICHGIELDPHYATVVIKRWEHFTLEKAHRVKT